MASLIAVLVSLVSLAAVGLAAPVSNSDDYCCYPSQYVTLIGQDNGLKLPSGQGGAQFLNGTVAVDFINSRVGEEAVSVYMSIVNKVKIIINYKEKYRGTMYLGDHQLTVDTYTEVVKDVMGFSGFVSIAVAEENCIPVSVVASGVTTSTAGDVGLLSNTYYSNFTSGIENPGRWFDIPDICKSAEATHQHSESHMIQLSSPLLAHAYAGTDKN